MYCFRFENCKNLNERILFCVHSHGGELYIYLTRNQKNRKNDIPCQAVANKLGIEKLPIHFQTIHRLKRVLVFRRILFKNKSIMQKYQSRRLKGSICNIPISGIYINCMTIPRPVVSNGVIVVKLKYKVNYCIHVLFEPVWPRFV